MSVIERTPIEQFYTNAVIFITGGSGFIGTALIEKLLRKCPDIKKIYMLMRGKKEKNTEQRLAEMFQDHIWDKLKEQNPDFKNIITIINGDLMEDNLGVSDTDYFKLKNEVSVIFHVAATVRFDEPLKTAAKINIKATKYVMELAKQCTNIKAVVHVSTAFSQYPLYKSEDCFYLPVRDPEEFLTYCDKYTDEELNAQTLSILGPYPNTYTFTKSLAENIVKNYENQLPLAVSRPSIVYGCVDDPIPGWTNSAFGPVGPVLAIGLGVIRVMSCNFAAKIDYVPVDMYVNQLIAVAYETSKHKKSAKVYNFVSGSDNPITWGEYFKWSLCFVNAYASIQSLWICWIVFTNNKYLLRLYQFFLHLVPAFMMDIYLRLTGKKPKMMKIYDKIHKLLILIHPFVLVDFDFRNDNTRELYKNLDPRDQILFPFDIRNLIWDKYIIDLIRYLRIDILKEPLTNLKEVQKKMFKLRIAHNILIAFFFVMIYWFFSYVFKLFM